VALLAATALLTRGPLNTAPDTGKDPASVRIRAATDGRITGSCVGVDACRETRGTRSRSQTKTDVSVLKTEAGCAGACNTAHHIELISYVAAKS
jgi:hypothetical protein